MSDTGLELKRVVTGACLHKYLFNLILSLFLVSAFLGCGQKSAEKSTNAKDLVAEKCSMCHFTDRIYKEKRSAEDWANIVQKMCSKNPNWISEEERIAITQYLTQNVSKGE